MHFNATRAVQEKRGKRTTSTSSPGSHMSSHRFVTGNILYNDFYFHSDTTEDTLWKYIMMITIPCENV